ncbi:Avirulence (Avh) protein [Phytophthora megakarya]|uniref:Avirulence (Avh) protein n=1 Tax=Phytophthora megakarya TaxID=4795 RepID=A0A225VK42_9STRA|nr:Avirulence (Avh) protein [Phytophthora megakarya]
MADKSKKSVMKKLKLNGLAGNALKSNKNYVFFENFVKMKETRETNRVNTWLEKNVPTYDVWKTLGLGRVRTVKDLGEIADTDAYKLYMRYVYAFDGRANTNFIQNNVAPSVISSETSWAEKLSRTANWVATDRSDKYVKAALGLDNLPLDGQQVSTNYQFYLYFKLSTLQVQQDVAEKTINFYLKHAPRYVKLTREARKRENNLQAYLHLDIVAKRTKLMREELN